MNNQNDSSVKKTLLERLDKGPVLCAEGYLFELERRGYLQAGGFVPTAVLDHPDVVEQLHREFLRAGSDVMVAFTFYGNRTKLRTLGKEHLLEPLNRNAIHIAKRIAQENNALVAGNVCCTNIYEPNNPKTHQEVREMFEEQVQWATEEGVDFILAETIDWTHEALIALDVIKKAGLIAVVNVTVKHTDNLLDGTPVEEACAKLEEHGADVVGINCHRGPQTILPLIKKVREAVSIPVACAPVPYRTTPDVPSFGLFRDACCESLPVPNNRPFPVALDPFTCNRYELAEFARVCAQDLDVRFIGICCGAGPHHVRAMADALGRSPPASVYLPNMQQHSFFGTAKDIPEHYKERAVQY
jgi:betaine-homocysteine S-methyltransferase